ncbi:TauD/TfdA family dioxygenase, partial [Streptomyces sp. NPDC005407]|uniref:TauD/TfdA family dioxygenase n=1 Tax=Streptomyces sp. NPDC005407 TaxID=3155340 RepID=UPI0033AAE29D
GRRDTQVKIRGFRIEIGEIENTLLRVPGVRDGAVVVAERADQSKHLAAFYSGPGPLDTGALTDRLGASLPEYMVPSAFHWRESLPLTANSKIDKKTLRALAAQLGTTEDDHEPPATPTEQRLAAAWGQVLGVPQDRIGRRDHFFDRGGTSLSAVKLAIALDRAVSLKDVTAHPVLTDLAALVDNKPQRHTTEPLTPSSTTSKGKGTMPSPIPASLLEADLHPGKPPILHTDTPDHAPAWAAEHRHALRTLVTEHGALLTRGLHLRDADQAGAVFQELAPALMTDKEAFAPRRTYTPGVYSSSQWPPNQPMCMHHELSYTLQPPGLMLFACLTAPTTGGATAIADAPTVLEALPTELVHRFEQEGWLLTRTYNDEIGAPYAQAFGTDDRTAIEDYCRTHAIDFAWQPDGSLRTRQHRPAVTAHPVTGRRCWFNQIAFLNEWTIEPEIREYLIDVYGADQLPFNTRFGSGDAIGEDIIQLLGDTYTTHTIREPWQSGDLMLVDNLRTAHSREAYEGSREVLVAMAEPLRLADCTPNAEVSPR